MKITLLTCSLALGFGAVAAGYDAPAPTDFETFATQSAADVVLEREAGSIESSDAKVAVTVLIVADTASPGRTMAGARFDLESNAGMDTVYLDEDQLSSVREDTVGIMHGIAWLEKEGGAPYQVQGTASCWRPDPALRILCPSYRIGPDWKGVTMAAYGGRTFAFPDGHPTELIALIDRAVELLESARAAGTE